MIEEILSKRSGLGDRIAVIYGDSAYTYDELDKRSGRLASVLKDRGIGKGGYIMASLDDPVNYVTLFFSSAKLGSILIPINPDLEKSTFENATSKIKPEIFIDDYHNRGPKFREIYQDKGNHETMQYSNEYNMERPSLVLLTGGTTGSPKGAVIPERSIVWNAFNTILSWGLTEADISLVSLPLYHTGGWNILLIPTLIAGGTVVFSGSHFDSSEILRIISERGVTRYMGVPTMLEKIVLSQEFPKTVMAGKTIISGGGSLREETAEKFRDKGARVFQGYGLTEAGPNNFYISPENYMKKPDSVGKPCLFVETKVAEDGELLIKGPHTFSGYIFGTDEQPFDRAGYLKTGDIFRVDSEGDYYFVGRKKGVIKTGGENVFSSEVESAILSLEYVEDCSVIGVKDELWGEAVIAFVSLNTPVDEQRLRENLKPLLAAFKIPKRFIFVNEVPRTPVGKPDREKMVNLYEKSIY
jgi:fatty-acyl-CoA synthase